MKYALVLPLLLCAAARAQTAPDRVRDLENKVDALSQEVEALKLNAAPAPTPSSPGSFLRRLSMGGYGEINAVEPSGRDQKGSPSGARATADLRRFVLAGDYGFSDRVVLKFEVEFEHATTGSGGEERGEAGIEQAYVDFHGWDSLNARAGHLLVPMGLINETHEPTAFHGVLRPSVETFVIPTTWHENGLGIFGRAGPLSYESYLVAGLNATADTGVDGFSGSGGLREGSLEGSESPIADKAWVSRLDLKPAPGLLAGAAVYLGQAGQGHAPARVPVSLWDVHGAFDWRGAELRALYAEGRIGNADSVNAGQLAADPAFTDFVGRRLFGGYVQLAFNPLSLYHTSQYLAPFLRWERYDTADRVPDAFPGNPATSRVEYTAGLTYKPVSGVALKTDYQWKRDRARSGVNQWNIGLGFLF